jgi:hypothetical protein
MALKASLMLAAVLLVGPLGTTAWGASPEYCAFFAREYARLTVVTGAALDLRQSVEDRVYYRCLNQDEDPPLPPPPGYLGGDSSALTKVESVVETRPTSNAGRVPVSPALGATKAESAAVTATGSAISDARTSGAAYRGSGLPPWTPEWAEWCAKYFPRSWDPATGTVVHGSSTTGERVLCK